MQTQNQYKFPGLWIVDPPHSWLAVPFEMLKRLGLEHQISKYSYISEDRQIIFLEEDCDAPKFIKKIEEIFKVPFNDFNVEEQSMNVLWIGRTTLQRYEPVTLQ